MAEFAFETKARTARRRAGTLYRELLSNQHLPVEQLQELQTQRSLRIAQFAMRNSPFYRSRYQSLGIELGDLENPDSFDQLPILQRSDVKENAEQFWATGVGAKDIRSAKTGGSTGQPLAMGQDARVPVSALSWRMYSWWGVQPWDNIARVGRFGMVGAARLRNSLSWWPTQQVFLDATLLDEAGMERFAEDIRRTRPALIEGYINPLQRFGEFLAERGIRIPAPLAIGTTAEPLTPNRRHRLESLFGAPIFDQYRCAEVQWLAGECREHNGLHIFSDLRRIEVVDQNGRQCLPGQMGEIVITDLTNRVFPIIRYRLGDRGMLLPHTCPCGITLPLMAPPDGRVMDLLWMPSGAVLGSGLGSLFSDAPEAVSLFQVHQHADYSITLRVVSTGHADAPKAIEAAAQRLRSRISDEVPVRVEEVTSLPFTGTKVQYVISDLQETGAS